VAAGHPADGAVDLGKIRRSEEIIDVLAGRAAVPARMRRDPAVTLLSALAADIDAREAGPGVLAGTRPGPVGQRRRSAAAGRPAPAPAPRMSAWARVAAVGAVAAGIAGTTSFVAAAMLARLARGPARDDPRVAARGWGAAVRLRRTR
jgi:hypothetical protein